ncbi:MAG: serine hydrolase, partial [Bacteroidetes bacterium]|nr:serine hydrolase [Bacteroidota bacterium]
MKYTVSENKFFRQYIIGVYFFVLFHSLLYAQQKHSLTFQVDSLIEIGIQKKAFPGAQVLILKKDSTLLHKAFGFHTYDSLQPVLTSDIYDLASVTKVLASTLAFMKLYELYSLDLDEPVSEYIPLIKKSNKSNSTFREVLSHSAGWIPYIAHQNLVRKKNGKFKARTLKHSYSNRFPKQISDSLFVFKDYPKKIMRRIRKTKLGAVGEYNYSGLWFFLLPELTQKLSGLSFEDFLAKSFYQPMKLERLGFSPSKKFLKN